MKFFSLIFLSFIISTTNSNAVSITPTTVFLSPSSKVVTVSYTNDTDQDINLQIKTLIWSQIEGKNTYKETNELIVSPAITKVLPGKIQNFRVTLRQTDIATTEKSYRLIIEDITADLPNQKSGVVTIRFNQDLAAFYLPNNKSKVKDVGKINLCKTTDPKFTCLRINNEGEKHVSLKNILYLNADNKMQNVNIFGTILAKSFQEFVFITPVTSGSNKTIDVETSFGTIALPLKN
jgi:fimbrial chaperone protein